MDPRAVLRFVVASVLAIVLLAATYGSFVLSEHGQRLENLGLAGAGLRSTADRLESLGNLSHISVVSFAGALVFLLAVGLLRGRLGLSLFVAVVMGASVVSADLLKHLLPRPELFPAQPWLLRNTFPSGTATVAAAIGIGAILLTPDRFRWAAVIAAGVYASAIGQATQIAGWHRLSDALGGVLLVMAFASFALAVLADRGLLDRSRAKPVRPRVVAGLLGVSGAIALLAAVVAVLPIAFPLIQAPAGASSTFVHTALDLIGVGLTVAMFAAFGLVLDPFSLREGGQSSAT